MNNIFTNDSKNQLSEEFNTLEKLEVFDLEASTHPLYSEINVKKMSFLDKLLRVYKSLI